MKFEEGNKLGKKFQPGESGNPAGKPKGTKHISTWIQEMSGDEEFTAWLNDARDGVVEYKGAPLRAIIQTALKKAAVGDKDAREWLAKYGWRKEMDITSGGEKIETNTIVFTDFKNDSTSK